MKQKKFSLLPYILGYKWYYLGGVIVLLLVDLANLYIPQYTGEIIDGLTAGTLAYEGVLGLVFRLFYPIDKQREN